VRCPRCDFDNAAQYIFCGRCGQPLSAAGVSDHPTSGERRLVTVLFACIPDLLALSEQLDPEDTCQLINEFVETLSAAVHRYGGTVDKFVGQELMVVFGAPEVHEDDAARALWAVMEMLEAIERFNVAHQAMLPQPLTMQCGVNTGLVFAGEVGAPGLRSFTVIGDAVNLANRLAYLAEPGQVFIGETTYRHTYRLFHFESLPPFHVRGRIEAVSVYILLDMREGYRRMWGVRGLSSPLVGRDQEFAALQDYLRWLRAGQGGVAFVLGEAGLGKSRVLAELRATDRKSRWLEGYSLSFQQEKPYFAFSNLLRQILDVDEDDVKETARRLSEVVNQFAPGKEEQVYPFLAYLLDVPADLAGRGALEPLSGEGLRRSLFRAFRILLQGIARDQPTVVVMEDLHWADESSLALLAHLMPMAWEVPLLFLLVLRPEPRGGILRPLREAAADAGPYSEIRLFPLSPEEGATLIGNLLQTDQFPPALQQRILNKAEGNPLFVEEITRALIQDGILLNREGRWQSTREVRMIDIPDTLRGLLAGRVDRLEPAARETLRRAAVIGRVFSERILAAVSDDQSDLSKHLQTLLDRNLVRYHRLEGEQGKAYIFNHALTHEAAYNGILREECRRLHRRVLEEMERLYQDRLEPHYATLARHAYLGELWEKAVHYLGMAGDRAKAAYALPEAVRYYQRAMGLVQEHAVQLGRERLAGLYHECCGAQSQLGDYEAARTVCSVLMEIGERLRDPYLRGHALRGAALVAAHTGDVVTQMASARVACQELERAGADWSRGSTLLLLGLALFKFGQLDKAHRAIDAGLDLVGHERRWPGHDPRCEALHYAALISLARGQLVEALDLFEQSGQQARSAGEQIFIGSNLGFSGLASGFAGDFGVALQQAEEGIRVGERAELPVVTYLCSACSAWINALAGRCGAAIRQALPVAAKHGPSSEARAIANLALGDAYLGLLDCERGLTHYQQALEIAGPAHIISASALRGAGLASALLRRVEEGSKSLNEALGAATSCGLEWLRAQALRDVARAALLTGEDGVALDHAEQLLALAEQQSYRELVGWGHLLRGLVTGNTKDLAQAVVVGQDLGSWLLIWEAAETLARWTGDQEAWAAAESAVRALVQGLAGEQREAFCSHDRVQVFLDERSEERDR